MTRAGCLTVLLGFSILVGLPAWLHTAPVEAAPIARSKAVEKKTRSRVAESGGLKLGTATRSRAAASAKPKGAASARSKRAAPARSKGATRAAIAAPVAAVAVSLAASAKRESAAAPTSVAAVPWHSPAETVARISIGEAIGLHLVPDPLALRSGVALVIDPRSGEILYEKNSRAVLPIASITKLMMAMVVLDAGQALDDPIRIESADLDRERASVSHLPVGSTLTRAELLQLALMSSENRAASALARNYPGGFSAFVAAARRKAEAIGMRDSVFSDGTGLSSSNVSTARDLAVLVASAARYALIRDYSTATELHVRTAIGARVFRTTNRMVASQDWGLSLQKTGYISEAGNCLVVQGLVDGRQLIIVLLDSQGRYSRIGDVARIKRWLEG